MHPHQPRDLHALARAHVRDHVALLQRAAVDAHVRQLAETRLLELERQSEERAGVLAVHGHVRLAVAHVQRRRRALVRGRQVRHDAVQQRLHAFIFVRGTHEHGHELARNRRLADGHLQHLGRDGLALEVELRDVVVRLGEALDELGALLFYLGLELVRNVAIHNDLALGPVKGDAAHVHNVHDALVCALQAHGDLHRSSVQRHLLADHADHAPRVRACAVQLVHKRHARHLVPLHLPVDGETLALHAGDAAQDEHASVEDA
mmetsp:Transcript_32233/g.108546  ORF Transcript_32233/g.108546 Transcript_32233/m.108546 type:complete len:262 (+) Transcript_32233:1282-2067(+)